METKNYVDELVNEEKQQLGEVMRYKRKMVENQNRIMEQEKAINKQAYKDHLLKQQQIRGQTMSDPDDINIKPYDSPHYHGSKSQDLRGHNDAVYHFKT